MYIIGVTGGVGSGKSKVVEYLKTRWGAYVARLDDIGRRCLDVGGACYDDTVHLFGSSIVMEDGTLDRGKIASIIFKNEMDRTALDDLIHPEVMREVRALIEEKRDCERFFVIESAILFEAHYGAICDEVWYIYADETTRYSRLASSRGYSGDRIRGTMDRQMTDEEFRKKCGVRIDNSGDFADTAAQVDARMQCLP